MIRFQNRISYRYVFSHVIWQEAIDLTCKPEFTEVNEGVTALRMLLLVEQT